MKLLKYFDYNSKVILTLFFLSLIVLILGYITGGKSTKYLFSTERSKIFSIRTIIRSFTHILGHENFEHFIGNYLIILLLGPMIEEKYGSINLLIMILITAFITSLINFIIGKYNLKGSSNIAFMLIVLSAFVNINQNKIPLTLVLIIIFYVIGELKDILKKDKVSHFGHLIGAICGFIFGFLSLNNNLLNILLNIFK